jgi:hypothetical protein
MVAINQIFPFPVGCNTFPKQGANVNILSNYVRNEEKNIRANAFNNERLALKIAVLWVNYHML